MNVSNMLKATMVAGALATGGAAAGIAGASAATSGSTPSTPGNTPGSPGSTSSSPAPSAPTTPKSTPGTPPAQKAPTPKAGTGKDPCPNMGPGSRGDSQGSHSGAGYSGAAPALSYQ